jgi:glycosyltransferase involved in cell wall biosynthesis
VTRRWHVLTPELPPACGGVGDYTAQVAEALVRSGDAVTVYCPPSASSWKPSAGVDSAALPDRFGPESLQALTSILTRDAASRLLIQYVPAVFGDRGRNLSFCRWVRSRVRAGTDVRVMFHEPYSYYTWRPDHIVTALTQRSMARTLLEEAPVVYLSTDTWRRYLSPYGRDAISTATTLPIPSAIPRTDRSDDVAALRNRTLARAKRLVGHFGTYGQHIAPLLRRIVLEVLASGDDVAMLCAGAGSDAFVDSVLRARPGYRDRLSATGRISPRDVSVSLQACDVLVQPYPDGVTTRRTSVMAGLANGRAVVTSEGPLTEEVWRRTGSVALASSAAALVETCRTLLHDDEGRIALEARALATYASRFDLRHTIDALSGAESRIVEAACSA